VVDRDEKVLGEYATAGQMQQIPAPRGGGILKAHWWQMWTEKIYPRFEIVVASLDTAYTEKQENDPSAMTIWGIFRNADGTFATRTIDPYGRTIDLTPNDRQPDYMQPAPKVMMAYAWAERLELHDLVERVHFNCARYHVDILLIENKAAGHSVAQEMRRLYQNEDWQVVMYDPKSVDKSSRAYSIQHLFQEGMIYAPGTPETELWKEWAGGVIDECSVFPKGQHDDRVDTVTMALNWMRTIGLLTRKNERLQELEGATKLRKSSDGGNIYGV
jgi:predicted phage terminase large subunit-like protein